MAATQAGEQSVVITGVGVVSPIGIGCDAFTANLLAGKSGIIAMDAGYTQVLPSQVAAPILEFNEKKHVRQKKSIKVMCREIQIGVAAASLALDHAGIGEGTIDPERLGVEFGANLMLSPPDELAGGCQACVDDQTHRFDLNRWGNDGLRQMFPLWLLKFLPNMPACHIGISADARGPNNSLTLDDASGNLVLGEASRIIGRGHADVMIAGATGTRLHAIKSMHARMWDTLGSPISSPVDACRPFDRRRQGEVVGEAASVLILESAANAEKRGAKIFGKILGAGSSCVLSKTGVPDRRRAMVLAMRGALRDAGLNPSDIGHVNAHGLGDVETDRDEAAAILEVFGSQGKSVPVTATKSVIGNSGSGAGVIEAAASLMSLQQGLIPPTLNFEEPDSTCPLNIVGKQPVAASNKVFLSVNVTRMGQASATVISAV